MHRWLLFVHQSWQVTNPSPQSHINVVCAQPNTRSNPQIAERVKGLLLLRQITMKATFIRSLELNNELKPTKERGQIPPVFAQLPLAPFGMTSPWALLGSYYVSPGNHFGQFVLFQYSTRVENRKDCRWIYILFPFPLTALPQGCNSFWNPST